MSVTLRTACHHPCGTKTVSPARCPRNHNNKITWLWNTAKTLTVHKTAHFFYLGKLVASKVGVWIIVLAAPISCFAACPRSRGRSPSLHPWQYGRKVVDGLVVLPWKEEPAPLHHGFGNVRGEEHPALHAMNQRVPRAGPQRINVYSRPAATGTDKEPSFWCCMDVMSVVVSNVKSLER